ncbi:MAG: threonylcarbamoyl-AMP synthase [Spirochaetaceae bacterium]|nr:threonylcarbamoyl-AMP synthase [Spirochaetaceae bacterium]
MLAPTDAALREAADILRRGGLVGFPTETVYGLGANALDAAAVERIFAAKGRPPSNPVIVHVASVEAARRLAGRWPDAAERLAAQHWPGPLTLVVERGDAIPDVVTAGGATVGLRVPSHPVALALLRAVDLPIAAPSANRSESVSPTTARHVVESLGPWLADLLVLDGGPCEVGIESTVVDVTGERPQVLRPGMLRLDEPETGRPPRAEEDEAATGSAGSSAPVRSPGQTTRHYSPGKPLRLVASDRLDRERERGDAVLRLPEDPDRAAALLYAELRRLDADPDVERILVVHPPADERWAAIRDRLRRAAGRGSPSA